MEGYEIRMENKELTEEDVVYRQWSSVLGRNALNLRLWHWFDPRGGDFSASVNAAP